MKHQIVTPQKQPKNFLPLLFAVLAIVGGIVFNAAQPRTESAQPVKSVATALSKGGQVLGAAAVKSPILTQSAPAKPNPPTPAVVTSLVTPLLISVKHAAYLPPSTSSATGGYEAAAAIIAKASDNGTGSAESSVPPPSTATQPSEPAPTTPVTTPTTPVTPPTPVCEQNGQLLVPIGGISCSRTITTTDGLSASWVLPVASSLSDTVLPTEKPFQVFVVVESISSSTTGYIGSSITYHLRALPTATAGVPAEVPSGNLNFVIADTAGLPIQLFAVPALVVAS
jgi:hypothetical protein